jgi:uncharacterized OB-fold protein
MAKQQTFGDKAKKGELRGKKCPVCGTVYQPVLLVASERSRSTSHWKFNERRVQVCKCNEKEVYA